MRFCWFTCYDSGHEAGDGEDHRDAALPIFLCLSDAVCLPWSRVKLLQRLRAIWLPTLMWLHLWHRDHSAILQSMPVLQSLSRVWLSATPWTAAGQASLSFTFSQSLLTLMSIESVMPSNLLIRCCPLLLPPSIFPSIRVFYNELALPIRWPQYWSFSFSISPSGECSGWSSFRMDWFWSPCSHHVVVRIKWEFTGSVLRVLDLGFLSSVPSSP